MAVMMRKTAHSVVLSRKGSIARACRCVNPGIGNTESHILPREVCHPALRWGQSVFNAAKGRAMCGAAGGMAGLQGGMRKAGLCRQKQQLGARHQAPWENSVRVFFPW